MERTRLISDYHEQFTIFYERASQYSKLLSEKHIVDDTLDKERLKLTYTVFVMISSSSEVGFFPATVSSAIAENGA